MRKGKESFGRTQTFKAEFKSLEQAS